MARKGEYKPTKRVYGNPNDPDGLFAWFERFLVNMRVRGLSERTIHTRRQSFRPFLEWAEQRSLTSPREITRLHLEAYQRHMYHRRTRAGKPLSFAAQRSRIEPLRLFFRWLTRVNTILHNPASELVSPKIPFRLPRHVLTAAEAEDVLRVPDTSTANGLRDRAILETFYSTGMRRSELANLHIFDIDAERGTVTIRQGKGARDRMIPIGERAASWIDKYVQTVRPKFCLDPGEQVLFLSKFGEPLDLGYLSLMVRRFISKSGVPKTGSCHIFRHSAATIMMEGGADIRMIQMMLGHSSLDTTALYTLVSIKRLIEVHTQTHPGARLPGAHPKAPDAPAEGVPHDETEQPATELPAATVVDLLDALDREAAEEADDADGVGDDDPELA